MDETLFFKMSTPMTISPRRRTNAGLRWFAFFLGIILVTMSFPLCAKDSKMTYPPSKVDPVMETIHGVQIADPYRWLEEADNPQVREWVEKQNNFTHSIL